MMLGKHERAQTRWRSLGRRQGFRDSNGMFYDPPRTDTKILCP